MGGSWTLRQKFVAGLSTVLVVSLVILLGIRLLSKSALFHYLEREHMAVVVGMAHDLELATVAPGSRTVTREAMLASIKKADEIAAHVDFELFTVEQWAFRLIGFGDVIDLPHKDMKDLAHLRGLIEAGSGPVTPDLIQQIQPDMQQVLDNSNRFGPMVQKAVEVVKLIVITTNLLGIAALCAAFWLIRQATLAPLGEALQTARRIQSGDLASPVAVHSQDEMGQLMQALSDMKDSLARVVGDVRQRSQAVAHSMDEVATGHGDLSHRTEQQASTIQQTASSVVQLTAAVQQSVHNAQNADHQASSAAQIAAQGGQTVDEVVASMAQILQSSKKISDIISVIDGIAFQTNILALNAAVEAARAGEQGRGFAVVAGEVRTLAQRSASAAKEIATLIRDSVDKVESGSHLVTQAGQTMNEVVSAVRQVSGLISEVNGSLVEQASGIGLIDQAMSQLDQATQQNAALAEESAATVDAVRQETNALVQTVGQFRVA
ncbi:MAG: HAMP domain-containing protein [Aquabacterium sp.]|uniref:methyl-accepting chemotaxis protein n=1 Tax=Aquabacterium sp. TaxID=1872578 RepID=UPI0025C02EE1|nr:methyl-accepting chemotaxis protein [Aquabacterium sp.]MBI5926750.1 HAMP domain-containing protein [Aquabacterium sp.]